MKYILEIIAFVSGAIVMILELVGSRIIAPYLGTSTIIWTSLIGVILGSLSIGYWWGGRLADKSANYRTLAMILGLAAIFVLSTAYLKNLLEIATHLQINIIYLTIGSTIVLFTPATICLGMISPYTVRLRMTAVETSGKIVGTFYAIGTCGSIVGTFLGGFVLISYFGSTKIILLLAVVLALLALFALWKARKSKTGQSTKGIIFIFLVFLIFFLNVPNYSIITAGKIVKDVDTEYSRIWIYDAKDKLDRTVRYMTNTIYGAQSGSFLDNPDELALQYTKFFDLAADLYPDFSKALMIGAGAYSYPKHFIKTYPRASMDVVEIDPAVTKLAKEYFSLNYEPRLKIIHEDGRIFLNKNRTKYNVILNDTFLSHITIPFQLTTEEAVQKMYDALDDKGVILTNIVSAVSGTKSGFLQAEYATYRNIFPEVYLIKINNLSSEIIQNIMLIGIKSETGNISMSKLIGKKNIAGQIIELEADSAYPPLTDELAPIEKYTVNLLP